MGVGLGFNMNLLKVVVSFAIVFLLNSSCTQNKDLKEELGEKVTNEDYQKVVIQSWGDADLAQMKKNDYAYVEKTLGINNGPLRKILAKGMTITDVVDSTDHTNFHLVIQSEEIGDNSQSKLSSRERVLSVKKDISTQENMMTQKDTEDEIQTTPFENFIYVLSICSFKNVQCYKLKVEDFKEKVPLEIQDKNCRHFTNCEWSGKKVSVVIKVTSQDPETKETKTVNNIISYKIVHNVPYLFKMVEYCFEGISEYQSQKFPIKICQQVKDTIQGN